MRPLHRLRLEIPGSHPNFSFSILHCPVSCSILHTPRPSFLAIVHNDTHNPPEIQHKPRIMYRTLTPYISVPPQEGRTEEGSCPSHGGISSRHDRILSHPDHQQPLKHQLR